MTMASITATLGLRELSAHRLRPLLWPAVMSIAMLAILLALGFWQLHRLKWKEGILARIAAAEHEPALPMPANPPPYTKVFLRGHFLPGPRALYGDDVRYRAWGGIEGGQLIVPFRADNGTLVLVDRGWVPDAKRDSVPNPAGETRVVGFARPPDHKSMFGVADDPVTRQFFTLNPARIATVLGVGKVAPYTLVVLGPKPPADKIAYPQPAQHLPHPRNQHLSYAMTWFGLAGALAIIFVSWCRTKLLGR